jgi:hypothetical protein
VRAGVQAEEAAPAVSQKPAAASTALAGSDLRGLGLALQVRHGG